MKIHESTKLKYEQASQLILSRKRLPYSEIKRFFKTKRNTDLFLTSFENQRGVLLYQDEDEIGVYL